MRKVLIVLAMLFISAARAQTSLTLYGIADLGIDRQRGGVDGAVTKVSSGIESGSRLGFKGVEDLGDGMQALVQLESGIAMDTGSNNQSGLPFGRQIYVGLKDAYGSLTLGRQYTALNNILCGEIDPFRCGLAGSAYSIMSVGGTPTNGGNGSRTNNAIKYTAPVDADLKLEATYAPGEVAGNFRAARTVGGGLGYTHGAWLLRAAFNAVTDALAKSTARVKLAGLSYDADVVVFSAAYAANDGSYSTLTNTPKKTTHDVLLGARVPLGPHTLIVSGIHGSAQDAAHGGVTQLALGYTYALSRRSDLYTSYGKVRNSVPKSALNAGGFFTIGNAIDGGTGNSAMNLGMR